MLAITTIGLDIAKSVFQVHGVDARGSTVVRRQLKRRYVLAFFKKLPPCLVGIEACATSHYWSRELQALGHTVRLIPPAYVKPYSGRWRRPTRSWAGAANNSSWLRGCLRKLQRCRMEFRGHSSRCRHRSPASW